MHSHIPGNILDQMTDFYAEYTNNRGVAIGGVLSYYPYSTNNSLFRKFIVKYRFNLFKFSQHISELWIEICLQYLYIIIYYNYCKF